MTRIPPQRGVALTFRERYLAELRAHITNPHCKDHASLWQTYETSDHTDETVSAVQASELLHICSACPARKACLDWAQAEKYDGVAGGQLLISGQPSRSTRRKHNTAA